MREFVHLHLHSEYSLLDGACRIRELVSSVKNLGQRAVVDRPRRYVRGY